MSSRWYPIYARGNPQLRIFLPNFWMKIVKNKHAKLPPNHVQFQVSPEMTRLDVKNYLEKIYNVPVYHVYTRNVSGEVKKPGFLDPVSKTTPLYKEDDIKYAYVTLPKDVTFKFPDILEKSSEEKDIKKGTKDIQEQKNKFKHEAGIATGRRGVPSFFGL
eukprot:06440.XXX_292252_292851_1 [CDS] Oithona nana genome sequencing.